MDEDWGRVGGGGGGCGGGEVIWVVALTSSPEGNSTD